MTMLRVHSEQIAQRDVEMEETKARYKKEAAQRDAEHQGKEWKTTLTKTVTQHNYLKKRQCL